VQAFAACDTEFTTTEPNPNVPWTPNAVTLISEKVADNVFAVYDANAADYSPAGFPLATSGGFVIGDDGVLLVETMINRRLLCQVYDLVRAETDLPVLYAVNTSHHGDHSYGNAFLPDEVEVVQHERTVDFITDPESFAADIAFMEANFGADQGIDEVTAVTADIAVDDSGFSVDLGGVTVEANYYGFGQTEGDLFVFVPEAAVMWTGNPLVAKAPAIPWLLDGHAREVSATLDAVKASLPTAAVVIPGHDAPGNSESFTHSIDYLNTLVAEVQASVDAGHDLEATQAAVTMETFQGYALWDWLHPMVNIPFTHSELSE
jgi:glyoxylase-like metal-dependent hydrolase (beta-lactamase superfamily II)